MQLRRGSTERDRFPISQQDHRARHRHDLGNPHGNGLPRSRRLLVDGEHVFGPNTIATDRVDQEFVRYEELRGKAVADSLLGVDGTAIANAHRVNVVEQFDRHCHQEVVAQFMEDCEADPSLVNVVGINDPWPVLPGVDTPTRVATTLILPAGVDSALAWRFGLGIVLLAYLPFGTVGAVVVVTDLTAQKIPAKLVLPAYPLAGILLAVASASQDRWWPLARAGIAMAAVAGFYLMVGLVFAGQLGIGDMELGGFLGLYLAWIGWSTLAAGTLVAWVLAAMAILARPMIMASGASDKIRAGPFLVAGALLAVLAVLAVLAMR
jgi:leader peptidase (prepilin peptidase)/N-methyltransferase